MGCLTLACTYLTLFLIAAYLLFNSLEHYTIQVR